MAYSGPTIVQQKTARQTATSGTVTLDATATAGNSMLVICFSNSTSRYFAVSDSSGSSYTNLYLGSPMRQETNSRSISFFFASTLGAATTVTANAFSDSGLTTSASALFGLLAIELPPSSISTFSQFSNGSSASTVYSAAVGEVDAAVQSLVIGGATFNASPTTVGYQTGFTVLDTFLTNPIYASQYKYSEFGETDERIPFSLGTARTAAGQAIVLVNATGTPNRRRLQAMRAIQGGTLA